MVQWLGEAYGAYGEDLMEAIRSNEGYAGIRAPSTLNHRYIFEDVPMSLVPMVTLGQLLDVPMPTIHGVVQMANVIHGMDYCQSGRTVERLGLKGYTAQMIREFAEEGVVLTCASD